MTSFLRKLPPTVAVGMTGLVIATMLQIVGAATTYWNTFEDNVYHAGIFTVCFNRKCGQINSTSDYRAIRAFTILAILGGVLAGFLMVLFLNLLKKKKQLTKLLPNLIMVVCIFTAGSCFLGIIIFILGGQKVNTDDDVDSYTYTDLYEEYPHRFLPGFSLYLCVAAGVLYVAAGILLMCGGYTLLHTVLTGAGVVINQGGAGYVVTRPTTMMPNGQYPYPQGQPGMMVQGQSQYPAQLSVPSAPIPDIAHGPPQQQQQHQQQQQLSQQQQQE